MYKLDVEDEVDVRRAAVLSVAATTTEMDEVSCGPRGHVTDVRLWTSLAAARQPARMRWDSVKQRFVVPPELIPAPEPEPEPEPETEPESAEPVKKDKTPKEDKRPKPKPKSKPKPKKPKPKSKPPRKKPLKPITLPDQDPSIVYAKLRSVKK